MNEEKNVRDEIRKEFRLERIMLFSDAVFAIVITLMAIEIRLPANATEPFSEQIRHLLPVILAYTVSFAFIGHLWYQHLHFFTLLKDYDRGLVVRNLVMFFCIGFFPFSVTLFASNNEIQFLPYLIYWIVFFSCEAAQLVLQHYILVKRPNLRFKSGVHAELIKFKKTRLAVIMVFIFSVLVVITTLLISNPALKPWAWWWFAPMPFILNYFQKKIK